MADPKSRRASDNIAHLAETLLAVGKELDALCVAIGADLFEQVEAAYPGHDSVTVAAHKLDALARSLELQDY
tara:strand:+ start:344 stop:559 length:216 start_codon:yes stop_codon:yes gene_type:complete